MPWFGHPAAFVVPGQVAGFVPTGATFSGDMSMLEDLPVAVLTMDGVVIAVGYVQGPADGGE